MNGSSRFFKFPKTEHIAGSAVVDEDNIRTTNQLKHLWEGTVLVIQVCVKLWKLIFAGKSGWQKMYHFILRKSGNLYAKTKWYYRFKKSYSTMYSYWCVMKI